MRGTTDQWYAGCKDKCSSESYFQQKCSKSTKKGPWQAEKTFRCVSYIMQCFSWVGKFKIQKKSTRFCWSLNTTKPRSSRSISIQCPNLQLAKEILPCNAHVSQKHRNAHMHQNENNPTMKCHEKARGTISWMLPP